MQFFYLVLYVLSYFTMETFMIIGIGSLRL